MIKKLFLLSASLFFCLHVLSTEKESIPRMGNSNVQSFDEGWLFKRFGLQADGSGADI